jgi:hypothetical protein
MQAAKMAYDVWKKESENKERVIATPTTVRLEGLENIPGLEIYNAGASPVAIKRVAFVVKTESSESTELMLSQEEAEGVDNGPFGLPSDLPDTVCRMQIDPKKYAQFRLDRHTEWPVGKLLELCPNDYRIEVESFESHIITVRGEVIRAAMLATPYGRAVAALQDASVAGNRQRLLVD